MQELNFNGSRQDGLIGSDEKLLTNIMLCVTTANYSTI